MNTRIRWVLRLAVIIITCFFLPVGCMVAAHYSGNGAGVDGARSWASRHGSTHQAPEASTRDAVIQVYAARAARWRGAFGVHTWLAVKRTDESRYTRLEVIGYRAYWGGDAVQVRQGTPDGMWFGNPPTLLREIRGDTRVDTLIDELFEAARDYPYNREYHVWPGPNSNTFTAWLARRVPELQLELPTNAIGKDYLPNGHILARTPSGLGGQLSLGGYAGALLSLEEGVEFNVLGLSAGVDLWPPAIKLPGIGRLGFPDLKRRDIREPDSAGPSPADQPPISTPDATVETPV